MKELSEFINAGDDGEAEAKNKRQERNVIGPRREKKVWNLPWQRMNTCSEKGDQGKGRDFH